MASTSALLLFPHQIHEKPPGLEEDPGRVVLIEDGHFFGDAIHGGRFHKQKLWFHRATLMRQAERLRQVHDRVDYAEHRPGEDSLLSCLEDLSRDGVVSILFPDPHDDRLEGRLRGHCSRLALEEHKLPTSTFLNTPEQNREYRNGKKSWRMADFYKFQRRRLGLLMEGDEPVGGRWSLDQENRKKVPRKKLSEIPTLPEIEHDEVDLAAREHVLARYPENPGTLERLIYPTDHERARIWLSSFLEHRLLHFGDYEDAMVEGENWLWHAVLTPMLNVGLLSPSEVVDATMAFAEKHPVPLNSLEGFLRQIIGWREFMRATYDDLGVTMRTTNHWGHHRKIPASFYSGKTGLEPVDDVIRRVLETGYCHHIERLMVLGGIMFLCEFDPDEVYRWFMELFIDSYDWVMVPNVYAMSQHADGGLITTKPYFSGSSYIRKMSNHAPGDWTTIWDGLYWRFIFKHMDSLAKNPRWSMMCAMARKMDAAKRDAHLEHAESFLANLG